MPGAFNCPMCGAPLQYSGGGQTVNCPYCSSSVIVPEELRPEKADASVIMADPARVFITNEELEEIKQLLGNGQKIEAIKVYRQATTLGLKEAKDAVEAIAAADPGLKNRPPAALKKGSRMPVILTGLFFFAIASIFPLTFFPMGVEAWQLQEYAAAFFSFLGAVIWAVIWGGIGWLILFSKS